MDLLQIILTIILLVFSVLLVIIIMLQTKRGEGLGGAVTGQSNFYNNQKKSGKDVFLKKATIVISLICLVLVVLLNIFGFISQ